MMENLKENAKALSARPYTEELIKDETTTGEPIYLIANPELPGCMAQGNSFEDARANLEDARYEYILSLLEDGEPVPAPIQLATTTGAAKDNWWSEESVYTGSYPQTGFLGDLTRVVQPTRREQVAVISLQT